VETIARQPETRFMLIFLAYTLPNYDFLNTPDQIHFYIQQERKGEKNTQLYKIPNPIYMEPDKLQQLCARIKQRQKQSTDGADSKKVHPQEKVGANTRKGIGLHPKAKFLLSLELLEIFPRAGVNNQERQKNREERKEYQRIFKELANINVNNPKRNQDYDLEPLGRWHNLLSDEQKTVIFNIFEALLEAKELPPSVLALIDKFSMIVRYEGELYIALMNDNTEEIARNSMGRNQR